MARLPPFDEPASPDVSEYREAAIGGFFARCIPGKGGADRRAFVAANRKLLDSASPFRGAKLVSEYSIDHREDNGCFEGSGPPTYYTTYRTYRLPAGTTAAAVFAHYEREYRGWLEAGGTTCERTFTQGAAYVAVSACNETLRLTALGRAPVEIPAPAETTASPVRRPVPDRDELSRRAGGDGLRDRARGDVRAHFQCGRAVDHHSARARRDGEDRERTVQGRIGQVQGIRRGRVVARHCPW